VRPFTLVLSLYLNVYSFGKQVSNLCVMTHNGVLYPFASSSPIVTMTKSLTKDCHFTREAVNCPVKEGFTIRINRDLWKKTWCEREKNLFSIRIIFLLNWIR